MERVPGKTPKRRLEMSCALPPQQSGRRPNAQALHALHRDGVQHKWVRPDQVFSTRAPFLSTVSHRILSVQVSVRSRAA